MSSCSDLNSAIKSRNPGVVRHWFCGLKSAGCGRALLPSSSAVKIKKTLRHQKATTRIEVLWWEVRVSLPRSLFSPAFFPSVSCLYLLCRHPYFFFCFLEELYLYGSLPLVDSFWHQEFELTLLCGRSWVTDFGRISFVFSYFKAISTLIVDQWRVASDSRLFVLAVRVHAIGSPEQSFLEFHGFSVNFLGILVCRQ